MIKTSKVLIFSQLQEGGGGNSLIVNELQLEKVTQISPDLATQTLYEFHSELPNNENFLESNDGCYLDSLSATKSGNPTDNGSLFRVIVFNPDGKYKTHADCVVGSPYIPKIILDSGTPYTIIAYSYNSIDYLPPMSCYQIDCTFDYVYSVGHSYAYQRIDNYILEKESYNILNIRLKHRIPHVKFILKTDKLSDQKDPDGASVNNSIIVNSHYTKAKIQLDNGNIIKLENPVGLRINMSKTDKNLFESHWTSLLINKNQSAKYITNISATVNEVYETKTINTPIDIKSNFLNKITINVIPNKSNPDNIDDNKENGNSGSGVGNGSDNNNSGENSGNSGGGSSSSKNPPSSKPEDSDKPKDPKPKVNCPSLVIDTDNGVIYCNGFSGNGIRGGGGYCSNCEKPYWRSYSDGINASHEDKLYDTVEKCLEDTNSLPGKDNLPNLDHDFIASYYPDFIYDNSKDEYIEYRNVSHETESPRKLLVTRYFPVIDDVWIPSNSCEVVCVIEDEESCLSCGNYTKGCVTIDNGQNSFTGKYSEACKFLYGDSSDYASDGKCSVLAYVENEYGVEEKKEVFACLIGEDIFCPKEEDITCGNYTKGCVTIDNGQNSFTGKYGEACKFLYGDSANYASNGKCSFKVDGKERFACLTGDDVKCQPPKEEKKEGVYDLYVNSKDGGRSCYRMKIEINGACSQRTCGYGNYCTWWYLGNINNLTGTWSHLCKKAYSKLIKVDENYTGDCKYKD